ncbi:MAG: DUF2357 domain-containing protein, partial [Lachnospiraceae bacterium]|nr:DUF2357 domain-containing protein [Lachnospiraceae bacterium]
KKAEIASEGEKKDDSLIDPIYQKFVKGIIRAIGSTDFYEFFMDAISRADNEFQFSNRKLEKIVDLSWVDEIDGALDAFQNIINSPRNVIKEEELIVNVANARKAGPETVRHLAQHASLVEEFNAEAGTIRPGRLMQRYREDSIGMYENRLVFLTLEYATRFVKIRHDALFEAMNEEYGAKLKLRSDMDSAIEHVHMDMFLHIREIDSTLKTEDKNAEVFSRISRIYRVLSAFMNSGFAQQMSKLPRLKGKVNLTNVLKKNPNYKRILGLYNFLKNYEAIGYSVKVVEQNPEINQTFQEDIYRSILFNYLILKGYLEDEADRKIPTAAKGRKRTLKPKFIHQIIEELTEDYDLPDVEVRKVLIEELTKAQLMQEEAAERRRLVEEQEQRKKAEAERIRAEEKAEKERIRKEKEAERERIRLEKEKEAERLRIERAEREIEDRRRGSIFKAEYVRFERGLYEQMTLREEAEAKKKEDLQDFEDAVRIAEETERLKKEEAARERLRKQEEREKKKREAKLALEKALAEAEAERIRKEEEAERARVEQEQREEMARFKQIAEDREKLSPIIQEYAEFEAALAIQLSLRVKQEEDRRLAAEARERQRQERLARKQGKR